MNYIVFVDVVESLAHLPDDHLAEFLRNRSLLFLEEVVELPRGAQLQHQVDAVLVREESVQLDDVGVVQERLDLDLPDQLLLEDVVQALLVDPLDGAHEPSALMPILAAIYVPRKTCPNFPAPSCFPNRKSDIFSSDPIEELVEIVSECWNEEDE